MELIPQLMWDELPMAKGISGNKLKKGYKATV